MKIQKNLYKNISIIQLIRHITQLIAFLFIPGLFISVFSAMKALYVSVIGGTFQLSELAEPLVLVLTVVFVTMVGGRFFCGFLCSFGAMSDLLWTVSYKLRKKQTRIHQKVDAALKYVKYIILILIVVLGWTLNFSLDSSYNPWTIFGMYASFKAWSVPGHLLSVGTVFLLLIIVGSLFVERFFCRYFCPLGAIFTLLSHTRLYRIKKPGENCGKCSLCTVRCSMGISLGNQEIVNSGECINCFRCVDVCPKHNISANPAPAVAGATAAIVITGLYYAGITTAEQIRNNLSNSEAAVDASQQKGTYVDGIYTGEGQGFRGAILVQVSVENGNITDIKIISTQDDKEFIQKAQGILTQRMISGQTAKVDAVSGATFSSNGMIAAVENALEEAKHKSDNSKLVEGQDSDEMQSSEREQNAKTEISDNSIENNEIDTAQSIDLSRVADGVYAGTGSGYRGEIKVTVTVSGGRIEDISVESYQDDSEYFERAKNTLIADILSEQRLDVDVVSGATKSSNGLLDAISNALGAPSSLSDNENTPIDQERGKEQQNRQGNKKRERKRYGRKG